MEKMSHGENHESSSNPLARQGSLYSLTLDEVQNQLGDLGKPLASMNLDELLKTVLTAETSQEMGIMEYGSHSHHSQVGPSIQRQSSVTLSRDLSKKTVNEVWQDIQKDKRSNLDRQSTFGEMTLEDFLVKAGIVAGTTPRENEGLDPLTLPQQGTQWVNYQNIVPVPVFMPCQQIGANPMMDVAIYPESQMAMSPTTLMGTLSDTGTLGRKRLAPGDVVEKSVERRQKRMIKNRESAARSRARKQAYTHELENKVSRLEEENERLKRQQEMEKLLPSLPIPEPKYQLRRTSSAPL